MAYNHSIGVIKLIFLIFVCHSVNGLSSKFSAPTPYEKSLVIVFDITGSMYDDIKEMRSAAKKIVSHFASSPNYAIYNFISVPYNDPFESSGLTVTRNSTEFLKTLDTLAVSPSNKEYEEPALAALKVGLNQALPNSNVYLFSDAAAKDYYLENEITDLIEQKQATVTFILTGVDGSSEAQRIVYKNIAEKSNGEVFIVGITDVDNVARYIIQKKANSESELLSHLPLRLEHKADIPVDSSMKELIITTTGKDVDMRLRDPNGNSYIDFTTPINTKNVKVYEILNPKTGIWKIDSKSNTGHTVTVSALADLKFRYGFARSIPSVIEETSFNPLANKKNIFIVEATKRGHVTQLVAKIEFEDPSKNVQFILEPVVIKRRTKRSVDNLESEFFVSKDFQPPNEPFKIHISGVDSDGNQIGRLLSSSLRSVESSPPKATAVPPKIQIREYDAFELKCIITSMTEVNVTWSHNGRELKLKTGDQSTSLILRIENAKANDAGLYVCKALNVKGEVSVNVDVIAPIEEHLSVVNAFQNMTAKKNEMNFTIPCSVRGPVTKKYQWFHEENIISNTSDQFKIENDRLLLTKATQMMKGKYKCLVTHGTESVIIATELTVVSSAGGLLHKTAELFLIITFFVSLNVIIGVPSLNLF